MHRLDALGQVYLALGRPEDAVLVLQDALVSTESPLFLRSVVTEHLSTALERCGRWREALEQYKLFHHVWTPPVCQALDP